MILAALLIAAVDAASNVVNAGIAEQIVPGLVGAGTGSVLTAAVVRKIMIANDPLNVKKVHDYAQKEDLIRMTCEIKAEITRIETRLQKVEDTQRDDINNVYDRINAQGETLAELLGLMKGIDSKLTPKPPRAR